MKEEVQDSAMNASQQECFRAALNEIKLESIDYLAMQADWDYTLAN